VALQGWMAGARTPTAVAVGLLSSCLLVIALAFAPAALALTPPKPAAAPVHTATATVQKVAPKAPSAPPATPAVQPAPAPPTKPPAPSAPKPTPHPVAAVTHTVQHAAAPPAPKAPAPSAQAPTKAVQDAASGPVQAATRTIKNAASGTVHNATHNATRVIHHATSGQPVGSAVGAVEHATGSLQQAGQGLGGSGTHAIQNATQGLAGTATHAIQDATSGLGSALHNVVEQTRGAVHQVTGQVPRHLVPPPLGSPGVTLPGAPTTPSHSTGTLTRPTLNGWKASGPTDPRLAWGQSPIPSSTWSAQRGPTGSGAARGSGALNLSLLRAALPKYGVATGGTSADSSGSSNGSGPPLLPGPAAQSSSGSSTAAGIALALAALLVALMAVRPPPSLRRLAIASATLRPAPELGTPDPPG
jgi:outer membrane biosynthesis protein TonB